MLLLLPLAHAVEGMWEPAQMSARADDLRSLGFVGSPSVFADTRSGPLAAVVTTGGCTASFVSADGLLVTNHHCVGGMLQYASKDGEDLVRDGVIARTRAEERPGGPAARVRLEVERTDVTAEITRGFAALSDTERANAVEDRFKEQVKRCETGGKRCRVVSYDGGSRYERIAAIELRDLRLVFVPPDSVGNYGDEIDNWHWPRHAGDFAFYRAYVGKDGKPADYAADNVPYRPKSFLSVSTDGVAPGDVVLTAGYPGHTDRWRSAAEVAHAYDVEMPYAIAEGRWGIDMIADLEAQRPDLKPRLEDGRTGLSNRLFYNVGVRDGFTRSGLVALAKARDEKLAAWIKADPKRVATHGDIVHELDTYVAAANQHAQRDAVLGRLFRSDLLSMAITIVRFAREGEKTDADRRIGYQERDRAAAIGRAKALSAGLELLSEKAWLARYLEQAAALPATERVPELDVGPADVDRLLSTKLVDEAERVRLLSAKWSEVSKSQDPMLALAVGLLPHMERNEAEGKALSGAAQRLRPRYVAALRAMDPDHVYADANSSFRVSYGTLQGYRPKDAVTFAATTTLAGVAEKAGEWPFNAPPALLAAIADKKVGPYGKDTVTVNFLTDLDTTGGNSGSPTLDARGRLVGLLFDGNVEGIASDWVFDNAMNRSIHCDIRYVLWYLDAVGDADALLTELGVKPTW